MQLPQPKLNGLDHLRALAITFVFLYHYQMNIFGHPEWLRDVAKFGWTGVDLFFVLSGFLISSQLFSQIKQRGTFSIKDFFIKRFFRILPAFWVVVAIYFCVPTFRERGALPPLWKVLTFTQNFGLDIKAAGTFSHAWSLCVEEHFYLVLPLTLIALISLRLLKRGWWILPLLFVAGFLIRHYNWNHFYFPYIEEKDSWLNWYKYVYYPTYNRLDSLLVGVSIAAIYNFLPELWIKVSKFGNLFILLGLGVLTVAYFLCEEEHSYSASVYGFPLVALGYGLLVIAAISPSCFLYKWNSKVTTFIAGISYAVYLSHKGIIFLTQNIVKEYGLDEDSHLMMLICIIACIIGAFLLRVLIEKPFLKLRNKIIQ